MRRAYISLLLTSASLLAAGCADPCADDGLLQDTSNEGCAADAAASLGTASDTDDSESDTLDTDDSESESDSMESESDSNDTASDTDGGEEWCLDQDNDGFGDPDECTNVPDGEDPPDGTVPNPDDCAPDNPNAYPGAAENEPPPGDEACMEDEDGDGWGDADPPDGVDPGTDCDDSNAQTFPGASENEEPPLNEACTKDEDEDGYGDNDPPDGGNGITPGTDCDDSTPNVTDECLAVDAGTCQTFAPPTPAELVANAQGGTGEYTYTWSPAASLNTDTGDTVLASPTNYETYTVTVDDGVDMAEDSVTVVSAEPFGLAGACELIQLDVLDGDIGQDASITYQQGGTQACEDLNNDAGLHLCDVVFEDTAFEGILRVDNLSPDINGGDNDVVGFVWGAQDASHFYSFSWKASDQSGDAGVDVCPNSPDFLWPGGMLVKKIQAPSVGAINSEDVFCDIDTANSEVLLSPAEASLAGWEFGIDYDVELEYTSMGSNIMVSGPGGQIADLTINDNTFQNGRFGTLTFSQSGACSGPWNATCL
ncbi:MAG: hypothetical protein AAGA54_33470 [Myxococcota bacterium]